MINYNLQKINSLILGNDLSGSVLLKSMLAEHGVKTKFCHITGRNLNETIEVTQPNVVLICLFDAPKTLAQELMDKSAKILKYESVYILIEESQIDHGKVHSAIDYDNHLVVKSSLSKHDIYNALHRAAGYWTPDSVQVAEPVVTKTKSKKSEGA